MAFLWGSNGLTFFDFFSNDELILKHRNLERYWVRISSTFSVLRPLYFDILSNLAFLLAEVKSVGRSREKVELMRTQHIFDQ